MKNSNQITTKLKDIKYPFYVLPGDKVEIDGLYFTFESKMKFNNREDLVEYFSGCYLMTEDQKEELRRDHIEGDNE